MSRNFIGILHASAFILLSAAIFGMHWLMTGIDKNFGIGIGVGVLLGAGIIGLASKSVRGSD